MNRRPNELLPLEEAILEVGVERAKAGRGSFYAYAIACELEDTGKIASLSDNGTIYKSLRRMESVGLLSSSYEDPAAAEADGKRPRRTLYEVTPQGEHALLHAPRATVRGAVHLRRDKKAHVVHPLGQPAGP